MVSVVTWNTQGSPLNNRWKKLYLDSLLTVWRYDFVLLQECGAFSDEDDYRGFNVAGKNSKDSGDKNNRCSTAIVSKHPLGKLHFKMYSYRPGIWVQYKDLRIGTIHAPSGGIGMSALKPFIKTLLGKGTEPNKVIVGADCNAIPNQFDTNSLFNWSRIDRPKRKAQRASRAHTTWAYTHMSKPSWTKCTSGKGKSGKSDDDWKKKKAACPTPRRLDYFVSNLICQYGAWRGYPLASDHYAVTATFSEEFDPAVYDPDEFMN